MKRPGYHFTTRPVKCQSCPRTLAVGEYYFGISRGNTLWQNDGASLQRVCCLPCRGEERAFSVGAAARILGVKPGVVGYRAGRGDIPNLRRNGPVKYMVPLSWIMAQKAARKAHAESSAEAT